MLKKQHRRSDEVNPMEYKQILIGTDGGDLMAPVYDHAAYFARLTNANVHIAYVLDSARFPVYPIDASANMYDANLDAGKQIVVNAKNDLASRGVNEDHIVTVVLDGAPGGRTRHVRGQSRYRSRRYRNARAKRFRSVAYRKRRRQGGTWG